MKLYKYLILIFLSISASFSLIMCSNTKILDTYTVKNKEGEEFFVLDHSFGFGNFKTPNSKQGNCLGICVAEKLIFEDTLSKYYNKNINIDNVSNYDDLTNYYDDNDLLDINKIKDNNLYDIITCIDYFQNSDRYITNYINIEKVLSDLNDNHLVILGLHIPDESDPGHAVLAYGYLKSDDNNITLYVSNPNKTGHFQETLTCTYENNEWHYSSSSDKFKDTDKLEVSVVNLF